MPGTVSTRQSAMYATVVCLALLIVSACGEPANPAGPTGATMTPVWKDLGEYTVTMTAAPSCSLPDDAMTRTYRARLNERGQELEATFDDKQFVGVQGPSGFAGTRDGEAVRFTLNGNYSLPGYSFVYEVSPGRELAYMGRAIGKMSDSGIVATLNGTVWVQGHGGDPYSNIDVVAICTAADHRMELVRK